MSRACRLTVVAILLLVAQWPAHAISKSVILRLEAATRVQYPNPGDNMNVYTIYVYRGKAYATTRGQVKGVATIAVWEYVPNQWHCVFDYPLSDAHTHEVTMRYRNYGFNRTQQNRVLAAPRPFP
jgi:hypothetical protein